MHIKHLLVPLAGGLTAIGITFALPSAHADARHDQPSTPAYGADPFLQRDFPCQEDEVLGFDPEFGPDRVGCIAIESLVNREVGDLTYCPADGIWSRVWHECPND